MIKPKTYLLVDDDADDTFLFREVLNEVEPSIELITAVDGEEALVKLGEQDRILPDLIFLDLNMPRMNGLQCLYEIKHDRALRSIPVIIYTTSSNSKDIEQCMQLGAACFITKQSNYKSLKN
ncbi:MAG TPA: response regulator, partial [Chitinophagaceae bacterium]|nr:response regulator [Chitinophagaceae bacterium]